jgi:hypothetical protein
VLAARAPPRPAGPGARRRGGGVIGECQTPGVTSKSSANELDFGANLCSNDHVFE